jgi:hypothetical protein
MQQQCVNASTNFVERQALSPSFLEALRMEKLLLLQELVVKLNPKEFQQAHGYANLPLSWEAVVVDVQT